MKRTFYIILIALFVILSVVCWALHFYMPAFGLRALMGGNVFIAALSAAAYLIVARKLNGRPAAFVRGVYAASFLKLMVCMVAMLVYIMLNRAGFYKPIVFVLFGMYAFYSVAETLSLSKLARTGKQI